jgi:hypothetical protein
MMIASGVLVLRRQPRAAAWYLASWLPMLLAMVLLMPMNFGCCRRCRGSGCCPTADCC